jgi:hypothetical protein
MPDEKKPRSGWSSTKLHLALIAIAVLTFVFVFVVHTAGATAGFGEYCIAVVTIVASAHGSRVAESFAARPSRPAVTAPPDGGN